MLLELIQDWCCREPVPAINHAFSEAPHFNVQPELPLTQLHSTSLCPITGHQREEIITSSFTALFEAVESILRPSFLQAEQTKPPQQLLLSLALKAFHLLWKHSEFDVLKLRCPKPAAST